MTQTPTLEQLREWIGRSETRTETLAPEPVLALAATLDLDGEAVASQPLPPLWHWLYFLPRAPQRDLGAVGHPALGGFLPPVPLPRRMWAGGELTFSRGLRVGDTVTKTSTITDVQHKSGRTGELWFVTVDHVLTVDGETALTDGLGTRWATAETSFKFFASCRHTHPAADALKALMQRDGLRASDIAAVTAHVHQGAIDVLGPVVDPRTIHQAKFSMGTVLGLVAWYAHAGLGEFEEHALRDAEVAAFREKVTMELDDEINAAYPRQWIGRVTVRTTDGRTLGARVDVPKGDPDNTLSRPELEAKAIQLAAFRHGATEAEMRTIIARVWQLEQAADVRDWLPFAR